MNDHSPLQYLLAYKDTSRAFARHSSLVPQEMSLNIDIKRILPVKFSGVSPNLYNKLLTFAELQRVESWEDVPLEFRRHSIDSVKVSVILSRFDPF